jgi:hypothetical protein
MKRMILIASALAFFGVTAASAFDQQATDDAMSAAAVRNSGITFVSPPPPAQLPVAGAEE